MHEQYYFRCLRMKAFLATFTSACALMLCLCLKDSAAQSLSNYDDLDTLLSLNMSQYEDLYDLSSLNFSYYGDHSETGKFFNKHQHNVPITYDRFSTVSVIYSKVYSTVYLMNCYNVFL